MMHEPGGATAEAVVEQPVADKLLVDLDIDIGPWLPDSLQPFWSFLQDYPLLLVLILAALGYVIGKALQWMLRQLLERITKRTRSDLDDRLTRYLTKPVVQTTVILALVAAVKSFGFDESADRFMVRILFSFLILLWGRAWFHAVTLVIGLMARDAQRFPAFQPRTRPLFEMGVKLVLLSIFIWLFMALWDIDGTAWLASAGVIVALSSDHTTDSNSGAHTADPVPSLIFDPSECSPDDGNRPNFGETACRQGNLPRLRSFEFLDRVLSKMGC